MKKEKMKIERSSLKSNIYDNVQLIIDYTGLTDDDIMAESLKIDDVLREKKLKKEVSSLTIDEINNYSMRKETELSLAAKKLITDRENALRYYDENRKIELVIYRTFTILTINYCNGIVHSLAICSALVDRIIGTFKEKPFFKIESIAIKKENRIYCATLYQLYRCFERKMIGDSIWGVDGEDIMLNSIQNKTYFSRGQIRYEVEKIVESGYDVESADEIYSGQLILTGSYRLGILEEINVAEKLRVINDDMFDIFLMHITVGFLEDMQKGESNRLIGGLNSNE